MFSSVLMIRAQSIAIQLARLIVIILDWKLVIFEDNIVSFAAAFWDVTQRSPLRDIPKKGCEGDYTEHNTAQGERY